MTIKDLTQISVWNDLIVFNNFGDWNEIVVSLLAYLILVLISMGTVIQYWSVDRNKENRQTQEWMLPFNPSEEEAEEGKARCLSIGSSCVAQCAGDYV